MAKVIKEGIMNVYDGFQVPFKADTAIYCVYVTDNKIDLTKIPAMSLLDMNGLVAYRLSAPYFVNDMVSTELLTNQHLDSLLQLKSGRVAYFADRSNAEQFARDIRHQLITCKKAEIERIKTDLAGLFKSRCSFDN